MWNVSFPLSSLGKKKIEKEQHHAALIPFLSFSCYFWSLHHKNTWWICSIKEVFIWFGIRFEYWCANPQILSNLNAIRRFVSKGGWTAPLLRVFLATRPWTSGLSGWKGRLTSTGVPQFWLLLTSGVWAQRLPAQPEHFPGGLVTRSSLARSSASLAQKQLNIPRKFSVILFDTEA